MRDAKCEATLALVVADAMMAVFLALFCMIKEDPAPADCRSADDLFENAASTRVVCWMLTVRAFR